VEVSRAAGSVAVGRVAALICHQSTLHTMTGLFAAAVVAVAEQLDRPPTVQVQQ